MGDTFEYNYQNNNSCSSSAPASSVSVAQSHSSTDEISLFLQQILVRSSSLSGQQFLFSSSPPGYALTENLGRPSNDSFVGGGIRGVDVSTAVVTASGPNVSSSSVGASENEADEYDCESEVVWTFQSLNLFSGKRNVECLCFVKVSVPLKIRDLLFFCLFWSVVCLVSVSLRR